MFGIAEGGLGLFGARIVCKYYLECEFVPYGRGGPASLSELK